MKELYLFRGLPGAGKSTLARSLAIHEHYEADFYFMRGNGYEFDASKLKDAHEWCRDIVMMAMKRGEKRIAVSNTFTQEWEMEAYYQLAKDFGYRVHSIIVENRHDGVNEHGVPADKLEQMKNRFQIKL
jgi:predicted kinase